MFCSRCGMRNPEEMSFCQRCGNPLRGGATTPFNPSPSPRSKTQNGALKIIISIIAIVVVIGIGAVICVATGITKPGYKKVAEKYMKAMMETGDINAAMETIPECWINYKGEEVAIDQMQDAIDYVQQSLNGTLSWEILDYQDVTTRQLITIQNSYDPYGGEVTDAKIVTIRMKYDDNGNTTASNEDSVIIKIGNSWYMDPLNIKV